jgi:hypothetical protein
MKTKHKKRRGTTTRNKGMTKVPQQTKVTRLKTNTKFRYINRRYKGKTQMPQQSKATDEGQSHCKLWLVNMDLKKSCHRNKNNP